MTLRFAGYAALFDKVDRGGDVIRRGAFARALEGGRSVPLLWQHRPERPIGRIESLSEDARGLRVIGRLTPDAGHAAEAAALLRDGAVGGLSFGYRVRAKEPHPRGRTLTDLDLVEVSLVTFPMQPGARVHAVHEEDTNV
ncbi:HK97 family phage prohead protease [Sphingomonas sp. CGMCC 1.13654]|uniref:HK97 family phage prohead protease n=1 Tax=Sphingomonas chungangi TaxID=2683589 RepID=A0A838L1Q7_9SPHN|nr:HK97 family phage prohead protease [Sphingomonas chungangi]MBA2932977.1 HK97 family phage prohead protease [Sphingomonas chungangi]MVW56597.1 HK97 family phage prohead protease [Sphingomonas chungangi]